MGTMHLVTGPFRPALEAAFRAALGAPPRGAPRRPAPPPRAAPPRPPRPPRRHRPVETAFRPPEGARPRGRPRRRRRRPLLQPLFVRPHAVRRVRGRGLHAPARRPRPRTAPSCDPPAP